MKVLVLDTIHGGDILANALLQRGDEAVAVDVYRGTAPSVEEVKYGYFNFIVAPVHLDPDYSLLYTGVPIISHHDMVAHLAGKPQVFCIEITGAEGKTTTAFAVACLLSGRGILHTSAGTYLYPEKKLLFQRSITPASLLVVLECANEHGAEWLVCEESLGVSGIGDLGILTSEKDYLIAAGKESAVKAKMQNMLKCAQFLLPERTDYLVSVEGCRIISPAGSFENPLAEIPVYRDALKIAAATAGLLGLPVSPLAEFSAVPGRMHMVSEQDVLILDNANSGTNGENTLAAVEYLHHISGKPVILVIGEMSHTVCEGLKDRKSVSHDAICAVIDADGKTPEEMKEEGIRMAKEHDAALLFAVKMWR